MSKVTIWKDLSGRGNDAVGSGDTRPEFIEEGIGGNPAVRFSDVGNQLDFPINTTLMPKHSYFLVMDLQNYVGVSNLTLFRYRGAVFGLFSDLKGINLSMSGVATTSRPSWSHTTLSYEPGILNVISVVVDGNTQSLYVDGVKMLPTLGDGWWSRNDTSVLYNGPNRVDVADIYEVLVYDRVLEETERLSIETYLLQKYGVV